MTGSGRPGAGDRRPPTGKGRATPAACFWVLPAIDLRAGRCVRLVRGRPEAEEVVGDDPVAVARRWQAAGAGGLHVVDLDGALSGRPAHLGVVAAIVEATGLPVQFGGGLRSLSAVETALSLGVTRAILGTRAISDPAFLARCLDRFGGERILPSLDVRDGRAAVRGWTGAGGDPAAVARRWTAAGCRRAVVTDAERDGTLAGPNWDLVDLVASAGLEVVVAGGVASPAHVATAAGRPAVAGVILGLALYRGALELGDALAAARRGRA